MMHALSRARFTFPSDQTMAEEMMAEASGQPVALGFAGIFLVGALGVFQRFPTLSAMHRSKGALSRGPEGLYLVSAESTVSAARVAARGARD